MVYLVSPAYCSMSASACLPSRSMVWRISSLRGVMLHSKGRGRMLRPSLHETINTIFSREKDFLKRGVLLRVVEDIHLDNASVGEPLLLDVESPEETCNGDPCPLLRECLSRADSPAPTERHLQCGIPLASLFLSLKTKNNEEKTQQNEGYSSSRESKNDIE